MNFRYKTRDPGDEEQKGKDGNPTMRPTSSLSIVSDGLQVLAPTDSYQNDNTTVNTEHKQQFTPTIPNTITNDNNYPNVNNSTPPPHRNYHDREDSAQSDITIIGLEDYEDEDSVAVPLSHESLPKIEILKIRVDSRDTHPPPSIKKGKLNRNKSIFGNLFDHHDNHNKHASGRSKKHHKGDHDKGKSKKTTKDVVPIELGLDLMKLRTQSVNSGKQSDVDNSKDSNHSGSGGSIKKGNSDLRMETDLGNYNGGNNDDDDDDNEPSLSSRVDSVAAMYGIELDGDGDMIVDKDYQIFENLQHSTKKTRTQAMNKYLLITGKSKYWFTHHKWGTMCCHNEKLKYYGAMNIWQLLLTLMILPLCVTIFVLLLVLWFLKVATLWIKVHCLCSAGETILQTIDCCVYTKQPSNKEMLDFHIHRGPTYTVEIAFSVPFKFVRFLTGGYQFMPLISNDLMYFMLALGPMAREFNLQFDSQSQEQQVYRDGDSRVTSIELNLHPSTEAPAPFATELSLFPGEALAVKGAGFDIENNEAYITVVDFDNKTKQSKDVKIIKPQSHEKDDIEKQRLWDIAKAHLQCMVFVMFFLLHGVVPFLLTVLV